ncbi:MAG: hypothetical protein JRI86_01510 [Deltaproteobacteria bacterium]|nr:hypothetical protein [Deltaproteobacteria bacterium]
MKSGFLFRLCFFSFIFVMYSGITFAADVTGGVDFASSYVFRGVTLNNGPVAQPHMEVYGKTFTFGVWGNFDIDDSYWNVPCDNQFSEIDLWFSVPLLTENVPADFTYYDRTYASGTSRESDRELMISFRYDTPLNTTLDFSYGVDGEVNRDLYVEMSISYEYGFRGNGTFEIGASTGYLNPDKGKRGFSNYTLSATFNQNNKGLSLIHVVQMDDEVLPNANKVLGNTGFDINNYGIISFFQAF